MNGDRRIERTLPVILADLGAGPAPDYADLLLARTARTRQRPAWVFPERWLPMDIAARQVRIVTPSRRWVAVTALLLIAAIVGLVLFAGSRPRLPAPFGVAGNGAIVFADGDLLMLGDPLAGTSRQILEDPLGVSTPRVSPDGTRIAYLRSGLPRIDLVVVDVDGSNPITLNREPLPNVFFYEWAPDSRSLVVAPEEPQRLLFDATRVTEPRHVVSGVLGWDSHNAEVTAFFRPPDGAKIVYITVVDGYRSIVVAGADGSDPQVVVGRDTPGIQYEDVGGVSWSQDGSKIAFLAEVTGQGGIHTAFVANADGSGVRRIARDTLRVDEGVPHWSPDGRYVALQRWVQTDAGQEFQPITVLELATGKARGVGRIYTNGYEGFRWSPDGRFIISVPGDENGRIIVGDVATGRATDLPWTTTSAVTWQRVLAAPTP